MAFRFGSIINDAPTIQVNLIGTALNIAYICFFFWYTNNVKDKMLAWSQIGYGGAFVAAIFAYTFVENPNDLAFRYGMIFTAVLFFFIGMPFLSLVRTYLPDSNDKTILIFFFMFTGWNHSQQEHWRSSIPNHFIWNSNFILVVLIWSGDTRKLCYSTKWHHLFNECHSIVIVRHLSIETSRQIEERRHPIEKCQQQ